MIADTILKNNRIDFTFQVTSLKYLIAVTILKMVPRARIELAMTGYQPIVMPFNYPGKSWRVLRDSNPRPLGS